MVYDGRALQRSTRRWSAPEIIFVAVALTIIVIRAIEMPANVASFARLSFSMLSLGLVFVVPYQTFARRAVLALALEAIVGGTLFALVDVPFVADHRAQIGVAAIAIAERIERLERSADLHR